MKFLRVSSHGLHCKNKMSMLKVYKLYHVPILFDMAAFVKLKVDQRSSTQEKCVTFFLTFFFCFFLQACWINERYSARTLADLQRFSRSACVRQRGTNLILRFLEAKIVDKDRSSYIFEAVLVTSIRGNGLMELESKAYGLICHLNPLYI